MILPSNGKIVIIDDVFDDVKPLMKALSQEGMPFLFYKDQGGDDLPINGPIENVRLVFLDLDLGLGGQNAKENIRYVQERLYKIIKPNTPYVLVIWSTHEDKYKQTLLDEFDNEFSDYKPIAHCSLDKTAILKLDEPKIVNTIRDELGNALKEFEAFNVFLLWENTANISAGILINGFTEFIGKDGSWDENAKHVLFKLSQAYSGKTINNKGDEEKLQDSFSTLNQVLIDQIENDVPPIIQANKNIVNGNIAARLHNDNEYSSLINNRLLLSKITDNSIMPGCLFFIEEEQEEELQTKKDSLKAKEDFFKNNDKMPTEVKEKALKQLKKGIRNFEEYIIKVNKDYNNIINGIITGAESEEKDELRRNISAKSKKIELNVSPLCDYAQEKMPLVRLLPGLLIEAELKETDDIKKQNFYNYFSDGKIRFEGKDYYFLFDFRYLYSKPQSIIKNRIARYKIRHQLIADIQLKLGSHINRSGVIYVQ